MTFLDAPVFIGATVVALTLLGSGLYHSARLHRLQQALINQGILHPATTKLIAIGVCVLEVTLGAVGLGAIAGPWLSGSNIAFAVAGLLFATPGTLRDD